MHQIIHLYFYYFYWDTIFLFFPRLYYSDSTLSPDIKCNGSQDDCQHRDDKDSEASPCQQTIL